MLLMSLAMMAGTLYLFRMYFEMDIVKAWTISLTTLAVFQWFNAWNCRSRIRSIFQANPLSNIYLVGAAGIVIGLQLFAVYHPFFQSILRTAPLSGQEWAVIALVASSIIWAEEGRKAVSRFLRKGGKE